MGGAQGVDAVVTGSGAAPFKAGMRPRQAALRATEPAAAAGALAGAVGRSGRPSAQFCAWTWSMCPTGLPITAPSVSGPISPSAAEDSHTLPDRACQPIACDASVP